MAADLVNDSAEEQVNALKKSVEENIVKGDLSEEKGTVASETVTSFWKSQNEMMNTIKKYQEHVLDLEKALRDTIQEMIEVDKA